MSKHRVTISDLAKTLKLSTCTVSKILNKSFDGFSYSADTIKRVEEAAGRLQYRVNAQARALRTKRSGLLGFVLPSAQYSVFGELTDQLELQLRHSDRQLLVGHSRDCLQDETLLLSTFLSRGVDGLLWIPSRERIRLEDYRVPADFPVVILDRPACCANTPHVTTDNSFSSRLLAERIRAAGHRRIAVLNSSRGDTSMKERFAGIQEVFESEITARDIENTAEAARAASEELFRKSYRFTALIALSEPLAIGALAAIRDHNIELPSALSFAAFDDFPLASHWSPRLTVLRQDIETLARHAAEKIVSLLDRPKSKPGSVRVPALLEWRESITNLKSARRGSE